MWYLGQNVLKFGPNGLLIRFFDSNRKKSVYLLKKTIASKRLRKKVRLITKVYKKRVKSFYEGPIKQTA